MSFDDDIIKPFPTRHGRAMGGAQERKMLEHIGGTDQIRKSYITNPDGTTTMLHTRGNGMAPEFITSMKPIAAAIACLLQGDIYELLFSTGFGPTWHAGTPQLRSTDGVFTIDVSEWMRWSGKAGSSSDVFGTGPVVHFNFSSASTAAVPESAAGVTDVQFVEGPSSSRTWHPPVMAYQLGYKGSNYVQAIIRRVASLRFTAFATNVTWNFSPDSSTTSVVTTKPACMNLPATEQGVTTRVTATYASVTRAKYINLTFNGKQGTLRTEQPYGFVPICKEPKVNLYVESGAYFAYANDLAKIDMFGSAMHGLITTNKLVRAGYADMAWSPGAVSCNTRYFKVAGLPEPVDPTGELGAVAYPADFIAAGFRYYNDLVMPNGRYAYMTDSMWLHSGSDNKVRILGLVRTAWSSTAITFDIVNYGVVKYLNTSFTGSVIGSVTLNNASTEMQGLYPTANFPYGTVYDRYIFFSGSGDIQAYSANSLTPTDSYNARALSRTHPVASSPDGRQVALLSGIWSNSYAGVDYEIFPYGTIHTVATVNIAGDLTVSPPTVVYDFAAVRQSDRTVTYTIENERVVGDPPTYYGDVRATTALTPVVAKFCRMVSYDKAGNLILGFHEYNIAAGPSFISSVVVESTVGNYATSCAYWTGTTVTFPATTNMRLTYTYKFTRTGKADITLYKNPSTQASTNCYRVANNVVIGYVDVAGVETATAITPDGVFQDTAEPAGGMMRYYSYNPRSNEIGFKDYTASNPNASFVTWI